MTIKLPDGTPEFMAGAYFGCLHWAIGKEEFRQQFEAESGLTAPQLPRNAMEAMVDKACGRELQKELTAYFNSFKEWHDKNIWGEVDENEMIKNGE